MLDLDHPEVEGLIRTAEKIVRDGERFPRFKPRIGEAATAVLQTVDKLRAARTAVLEPLRTQGAVQDVVSLSSLLDLRLQQLQEALQPEHPPGWKGEWGEDVRNLPELVRYVENAANLSLNFGLRVLRKQSGNDDRNIAVASEVIFNVDCALRAWGNERPVPAEPPRTGADAEIRVISILHFLQKIGTKPQQSRGTRLTVNERMLAAIQKDQSRKGWSSGEWAEYLGCSKSSVVATATWPSLKIVNFGAGIERLGGGRKSDRRRRTMQKRPNDSD